MAFVRGFDDSVFEMVQDRDSCYGRILRNHIVPSPIE